MNKLQNIKNFINIIQSRLLTRPDYLSAIKIIKKIYYIARASFEKFQKDSCNIRSSSIAYAIAISVIPILTILIRFASIDRIALRANLASFLAANGMADATELLGILDEILGRANQIAGLGILFMLYSATNLVRNLEDAFNHIYRARNERPMIYRFALYIASFAIIPTLIIFSTGAARLGLSKLQPAEPVFIHDYSGSQWILHEPGILWKYKDKKIEQIDLYERANTGASFRDIFVDENNSKIGPSWEIVGKDHAPPDLVQSDLYESFLMKSRDGLMYVFSKKGLFMYSNDQGNTWQYRRIFFKLTDVHSPQLDDIHITDQGKLVMLLSINSRSGILSGSVNGDWKYTKLDGIYSHFSVITTIPDGQNDYFKNGLYLLGKGVYRYSADNGQSFGVHRRVLYGNKSMGIVSLKYSKSGQMFVTGTGGIWIQEPDSQFRPDLRLQSSSAQIRAMDFLPNGDMFLYGNGSFRYSKDDGKTWLQAKNKELNSDSISAHEVLADGSILLTSENQSLFHLKDPVIINKRDSQGFAMVEFKIKTVKSLHPWIRMIGSILVSIFIFTSCYLMFLFTYKFVPNTIVKWQAASIGSLFTSITILGFFIVFKMWITGFTTTGYIYGVWAAIPLGMLVILSSTAIILFGLELAYIVQHPILYKQQKRKATTKRDSLLWSSILMLSMIYHKLYDENSALTDEQAIHYFSDNAGRLDYIRDTLLESRLISYNEITGEYYPVKPASEISLLKLQKSLVDHSLRIPSRKLNFELLQASDLQELFDRDLKLVTATLGKSKNDLNMADLLPILADKKKTNK